MAKIPKAEVIIKKNAWSAVVESLALIILGLLFVLWPDTMIKIMAYLIGAFFIVKGGYKVANYYMEKGPNDFLDNGLLSGVVAILIGIAALMIGENIAHVFRVVIGIIIIYEALVRINTASKLHSVGVSSWQYILGLALIMLVLGIFVTFYTGAIVALIGWLMILTGVIGIVGDMMFIKHVNAVIDKITKPGSGVK